ncbi:glutaconyl-CoA decarboxylase subunit gamma-like [Culicoides brevitarsis]|uniref:glutaconyl-CoA decarboxylase subunit gamma-like n=1 Tax=Culicoides brevitarsis TaxID=469753 RepID=UPI00307B13F6
MCKLIILVALAISAVSAKPGVVAPLAYSAPAVVAPGVVAAQSSQVFARNYNGLAAPLAVAAPAIAAPAVAAPLAAPLAYNGFPFAARYAAAPVAAPLAAPVAAPLAAPLASPYAALPYSAALPYAGLRHPYFL